MSVKHLFERRWRNVGMTEGKGMIFEVLMLDHDTIYATADFQWSYSGSPEHFAANFVPVA